MTTITVFPDGPGSKFHAFAGERLATGNTVGEALDELRSHLGETGTTLVILPSTKPDHFFNDEQQSRLRELMAMFKNANGCQQSLSPQLEVELKKLMESELQGAIARSQEILSRAGE